MPKKKLITVKDKYNYFIKRYYEIYGSAKEEKNEADLLLEKAVFAFLELNDCEKKYSRMEDFDTNISSLLYEIFEESEIEGIIDSDDIVLNFNNDKIETEETGFKGEDLYYEREESDNSDFHVKPVFGYCKKYTTNRTVGIEFNLQSQLGCLIKYTEVDFERLKHIQKSINILMEKIESCNCTVKVIGYGSEYEFITDWDFNNYPEHLEDRTNYLNCNHRLPEYYEVINVKKFGTQFYGDLKYGEEWHVEFTGTEINVIGYPCNFTFLTKEKFLDPKNDNVLRDEILQSKLGDKYYVKNVIKNVKGEEWLITCDGIEDIDLKNSFKISIKGYPDTFSFTVIKKFKPFDNEDFEADDDGRGQILILKMYELKVKSISHAYEDYVIERVRKVKGGEEWILGS